MLDYVVCRCVFARRLFVLFVFVCLLFGCVVVVGFYCVAVLLYCFMCLGAFNCLLLLFCVLFVQVLFHSCFMVVFARLCWCVCCVSI